MKQKLVEKATNIYNEAKNRRIYKPKIKLLEMTGDLAPGFSPHRSTNCKS